jgi:hypothetical protein
MLSKGWLDNRLANQASSPQKSKVIPRVRNTMPANITAEHRMIMLYLWKWVGIFICPYQQIYGVTLCRCKTSEREKLRFDIWVKIIPVD